MKHAYLIMAHNEAFILERLISMIDDKRNDIYLFVDKKADSSIFKHLKPLESNLYICERFNVYWGGYSVIKAELTLFETAWKNGPYKYYHLLSGVCLPIKSQDYIHDFFDKNEGKEFVGYIETEFARQDIDRKTSYYHLFVSNFANPNLFFRITKLQGIIFRLQKYLRIRRNHKVELHKGSNWVSITHECVSYLLDRKKWIKRHFNYTLCGDEIFIQTILWDSYFKNRIYNIEDCYYSSMRYIDFHGWHPRTLTMEDYNLLKKSNRLFARKFSSDNMDLVYKIYNYCKREGYGDKKKTLD